MLCSVVSDGTERLVQPEFTWFGFRYFSVQGGAEVLGTRAVHSNVAVTAEFECDNEDLNWMFRAFINTQLSNTLKSIQAGEHTLTLRVADTKAEESEGTAIRIGAFMVY